VPGLVDVVDQTVLGALFLDRFSGEEGTSIEAHEPDIAPAGFAWALTLRELELDGDGHLVTPDLGGTSGDGSADSGDSAPVLNLELVRPFSIQIVALQPADEGLAPEGANFRIANDTVFCEVSLHSPLGGGPVVARFYASVGGQIAAVDVDDELEHTVKAKFNEDGSTELWVDGTLVSTFAYVPITSADQIQVYVSRGAPPTTRVSEVRISQGAFA
jgi:hypothetical protein